MVTRKRSETLDKKFGAISGCFSAAPAQRHKFAANQVRKGRYIHQVTHHLLCKLL